MFSDANTIYTYGGITYVGTPGTHRIVASFRRID